MIACSRYILSVPLLALAACDPGVQAPQEEAESEGNSGMFAPELAAVAPPPLGDWMVQEYGFGDIAYFEGEYDLDGDGYNEILAYLTGPMHCGSGGCNLLILKAYEGGYRRIGDLSVARLPVGVFPESNQGWRDLAVNIGGGGMASAVMRVPFEGEAYASNPTVAPATPSDEPFDLVITDGLLPPVE